MADQLSLIPDRPMRFDGDAFGTGRPALCEVPAGDTMAHRCARFFADRPNVWVDGRELMSVCGGYAWRTRIADCRRLFGMEIRNRQRREGRFIISEYILVLPGSGDAA